MSHFKAKKHEIWFPMDAPCIGHTVSETNKQYWIYYCDTLFSLQKNT